ncbi:hypothetical protein phi1p267 [Escherichia phage Phi1]|uniref:Uncharacterized protein n=1 Tax=Escherichia phage Phi1 TaxID=448384 RepID=A7XFP2_9CAUD|nr:hypothetical protein phi1p267 [Escherichia phage Phi1]ABR24777.1 hypothetical protein phi1p267 [Escherichia phage Phi1]
MTERRITSNGLGIHHTWMVDPDKNPYKIYGTTVKPWNNDVWKTSPPINPMTDQKPFSPMAEPVQIKPLPYQITTNSITNKQENDIDMIYEMIKLWRDVYLGVLCNTDKSAHAAAVLASHAVDEAKKKFSK